MKTIHTNTKKIAMAIVGLMAGLAACSDPEVGDPVPSTSPSTYSANFLLVNASPDAPSLDLLINNTKAGASVTAGDGQSTYTKMPITSNGVFANTNIRAKASSGTIGGVLGSADLIFRAGNNNSNNLQVSDSATYTIIAVDSISRPKPIRTLNSKGFGDTTYFNPLSGKMISVVEKAALTSAQKAKLVSIGTVPLGSSDPGGVRFIVVLDQLKLPSTTRLPKPAAGKASVRFIHASPDAGTATVTADAVTITNGTLAYPLRFPGFTPSVGSRSISGGTTPLSYSFQTIDAGPHDLVVKVGGNEVAGIDSQVFDERGVYTIVLTGRLNDGSIGLTVVKNK